MLRYSWKPCFRHQRLSTEQQQQQHPCFGDAVLQLLPGRAPANFVNNLSIVSRLPAREQFYGASAFYGEESRTHRPGSRPAQRHDSAQTAPSPPGLNPLPL